jgi:uncharacterized protein YbjT (DUF2867 family)
MTEVLVLGGTGKTGRRVAAQLAAAGHTARAAARTPGPAAPGVVPVRFAWDEPETYDPALAGVDAVYLVPPARRLDHPPLVRAFLERVRAAGGARVVLLSARGVEHAPPEAPLRAIELALEASGLPWTVLRPSWFMQNLSEDWLREGVVRDGVVPVPTGEGRTAFIDCEDIAEVAVAALTQDGHAGRAYELTGPAALTWAQAAAIVGAQAGREVRHVDVDPAAWEAGAVEAGFDPAYAAVLGMLFAGVRAGAEDGTADGVRAATGREPTSLEAFAAREAAAWRPQPVAAGDAAR